MKNEKDGSPCELCAYCINDDCLLDFEGAADEYGDETFDCDEVSECENCKVLED